MSRRIGPAEPVPGWRPVALAGALLWGLAVALELAFGAWAWRALGPRGGPLLGLALNGLVALRFALTLRPRAVPLITRYARADRMGLPREAEGYTRALTALWAGLIGGFALAQAGPLLSLWTTRDVTLAQAAACLALFLGEHAWRNRALPQLGRATPWRTLRAIREAHRAA